MRFLRLALCGFVMLGFDGNLHAQDASLGNVNFPSSCNASAQSLVTTGVALLHSFQFQQAKQTFQDAAKSDAQCAIAYWGQTMSLYHQLWDFPQEDTLREGREYLAKSEKATSASPRERAYIAAAEVFYRDDSNLKHLQRVQDYSGALAKLHRSFPDDVEGAAFYGLSLIAIAMNDDDHDHQTAKRRQAIALLDPLFRAHPENPGLAHYLIHAADTPEFAAQGLEAARRYAKIAPDSSHAIHMPSHIFVRLGLWRESVASNIAAIDSGARAAEKHLAEAHYQAHAMDFLNYSYLQNGQEAKAREVIASAQNIVHGGEDEKAELASWLSSRTARELHRWKEAAELPIPKIKLVEQDSAYGARIVGKAHLGDVAGARMDLEKLQEVWAAQKKQLAEEGYPAAKEDHLGAGEIWLLFAEGKRDHALEEMRAAADREDAARPDSLAIPFREQLGDILLELKRPSEAAIEYKTALKNSPNRFNSLYGVARSLELAGDAVGANGYYAKLVQLSSGGDRPELAEARMAISKRESAAARH